MINAGLRIKDAKILSKNNHNNNHNNVYSAIKVTTTTNKMT
jgi:hypothetical protein